MEVRLYLVKILLPNLPPLADVQCYQIVVECCWFTAVLTFPSVFWDCCLVLPALRERLGDARQPVRDASLDCLLVIMEAIGSPQVCRQTGSQAGRQKDR